MTRIVVTGAAGFIGSNIVKALNERGLDNIIAVDDLTKGDKFRNLADLRIDDYVDADDFYSLFAEGAFGKVEAVFHEGACSDTMETDGKYMMDNNYTLSCEPSQSSTSCLSMTDGHPIAPTLMRTAPLFTSSDANLHDSRYVVLMTDGPPGCGEDATEACNTAVTAVSNLAKSAVVPVVALGDEAANNSCLKSMAMQGGYFVVPPPVTAKDTKSLTASLIQIVAKAASQYCTIKLSAPRVDPGQEVVIWAFGHWITPHDSNNGWEFWPADQSQWIQVYGDACRMILQGTPRERIDVELCPKGSGP